MPPDPLSGFNSKTFAAQLHTQFKVVQGGEPPVILELTEVNERQTPPEVELFIVVFQGPRTPRLEQRTHHFEHDVLGAFDMFITPIAADAQRISYNTSFHRLHTKKS